MVFGLFGEDLVTRGVVVKKGKGRIKTQPFCICRMITRSALKGPRLGVW